MDNKLSKPVMYSITCNGVVEEIGGDAQGFSREEVQAELDSWDAVVHGVYSVSALYSQEYVSVLTQRIEELEAKLAAPVRLPLPYSPDPWMSPDPDGTWLDKEDVKKSIRAAGFVVELCSACNERYCGNCAHANGAKVQ
ncbi:hypothetical protein JY536_02955 [Serratia marcescens]|nr:hypothetical protein [Serratia marcescens]